MTKKKNKYDLDNTFAGKCTECRKVNNPDMIHNTRRVCSSCWFKLNPDIAILLRQNYKRVKDGRN